MAIKSIFNFGRKKSKKGKVSKRKVSKRKGGSKKNTQRLPKKLLSICKSLKVKVYSVRNGKRVKKSLKVLKSQCLKKVNALIKLHKRKAKFGKSRSKFGVHTPGHVGMYTKETNPPHGMPGHDMSLMFGKRRTRFGKNYAPYYPNDPSFGYSNVIPQVPGVRTQAAGPGVNADFFGSKVPKPLPPNWQYMQGPTGPATPLGYPFEQSTKFGKKLRRRY
jgi:hypothetical protein